MIWKKGGIMPITISISDDIIEHIKIPRRGIDKKLKEELAFSLYEKEFASMGIARKLAGLSKIEFIDELAKRKIFRHYTEKELEEDIRYAEDSE